MDKPTEFVYDPEEPTGGVKAKFPEKSAQKGVAKKEGRFQGGGAWKKKYQGNQKPWWLEKRDNQKYQGSERPPYQGAAKKNKQ